MVFLKFLAGLLAGKKTYLATVLAVAAVVLYALGFIDATLLGMVLPILGFAGLAALRAAILSSGYKTYLLAGGGALVHIAYVAGLIVDQKVYVELMTLFAALTAAALRVGVAKQ